jgi:single-strand DNA-binding protein
MLQKIILIGNLGRDPEMRYLPDGRPVTSFSLATNRSYTGSDGQRVKDTTWFRISVFGNQAEPCNNFLAKGSKVYVEGRLQSDPATGGPKMFPRQDGTLGTAFEVISSSVQFLDSKSESGDRVSGDIPDDEIPF